MVVRWKRQERNEKRRRTTNGVWVDVSEEDKQFWIVVDGVVATSIASMIWGVGDSGAGFVMGRDDETFRLLFCFFRSSALHVDESTNTVLYHCPFCALYLKYKCVCCIPNKIIAMFMFLNMYLWIHAYHQARMVPLITVITVSTLAWILVESSSCNFLNLRPNVPLVKFRLRQSTWTEEHARWSALFCSAILVG